MGSLRIRSGLFKSVRARTTAAAMAVVAVALFLAALAILANTWSALNSAALSLARNQISEVALLVKGGEISDPLPIPRGDLGLQIIDAMGKVAASTSNISGFGSLARISRSTNSIVSKVQLGDHSLGNETRGDSSGVLVGQRVIVPPAGLKVVKYGASPTADFQKPEIFERAIATSPGRTLNGGATQPATVFVLVWASLASSEQSTHAIETSLSILFPILVLFVGFMVWFLTGRALGPVEKIRSEVATISGSNLHSRVFVPPTHDEIAKLAATMNEMLNRLEASSENMRQFVSDASHELKSPIASIRAELEVSLLHPEATEIPSALMAALAEADRMQRIVEDLLTLAKIDEKVIIPKFETVDLDEIIASEARRLRLHHGVIVDASDVRAARIRADGDQIFRIVRNLLENAARHAHSRVAICLQIVDGIVELRISDDGPGIAPAMVDKVFERFHRVDEDRSRMSGGSGLGLAIVASLVELHGGTITVLAQPGQLGGAEFVLRLPADEAFLSRNEVFQPIHNQTF